MELCLGTVQFGMQYGIAGHKRPSIKESLEMMDYAVQNGVATIDTANAYGNAEEIVGRFLNKKSVKREKIRIISKLQPNILDDHQEFDYYRTIKKHLENTLRCLQSDFLDGFLLHSARYVYNEDIIFALTRLKAEGYVQKIGVSIYEPAEAIKGLENTNIDLIQLPYSIFDQRMKDKGIFDLIEAGNIEIHSRSAFLQGLILMKRDDIPKHLAKAVPIIEKMDEICQMYSISRIALALNYIKQQKNIGFLVFGVHNLLQLKENIYLFNQSLDAGLIETISNCFKNLEHNIIMPSLWNKC